MEIIAGLFIFMFVMGLIAQLMEGYWHIVLIILAVSVPILFLIIKNNIKEARRQDEENKRKANEKEHKKQQKKYLKKLIRLSDNSLALFEEIPNHLITAEECLKQAEREFLEGAFAPFWDAIEKTVNELGWVYKCVENIRHNLSQYTDVIKKYEDVPPQFPLARKSIEKISIGNSTAERMKEIVRNAQRNFQFATIYEQRKTNQILVAGFTNLAQALDQMTWQIANSIDNLVGSVDSMTSTLNESTNAIHSRLGDMIEANIDHNSEVMKLESDRVIREKKVLEMLDTIHLRRLS